MKPVLDWSSYQDAGMGDAYADIPKHGGDFAKAVAVCIRSGGCERENNGIMCPSFKISGNPNLSTGGRVRLLKRLLNDTDSKGALANPELAEAMALCVACKGCQRECESEVDMAMLKVEYLAQRYRQRPADKRTRLFAALPRLLHRYPALRNITQRRNRSPWLASLGEHLLGISANRQLPVPTQRSFFNNHNADVTGPENDVQQNGELVLFIDTFIDRFTPEIADAAIEVLSHAGYQIRIARPASNDMETQRPLCCGRTFLANGLIDQAREEAQRVIDALLPHVEAGCKIIGLEPSCLLAIRDDYAFLGLGEPANRIASEALLFEEFIAREITAKRFNIAFETPPAQSTTVLVHGHCHQKAAGAMKAMRRVLKQIPNLDFSVVQSSCCGMAGSFGVEAEHTDLAMQMGEAALFPAVREQPEARIVANGFSCREQIREGTGRASEHLALLLQSILPKTR